MRAVNLREPVNVIVQLDLGCFYVGMPHQPLEVVKVHTLANHGSGKGVTQLVSVKIDPAFFLYSANKRLAAVKGQGHSIHRDPEGIGTAGGGVML
jgi:hypothetical protein